MKRKKSEGFSNSILWVELRRKIELKEEDLALRERLLNQID